MDLISLCNFFAVSNLKCNFYIDKIYTQKYLFIESLNIKNLLIFLLFFIFFFFLLYFLRLFKNINKYILIFVSFNFAFFSSCITIYPSNIPFTDTWVEIYYLIRNDQLIYLFMGSGSHPFLGFRLFHLIIYKYFSLNYSLLHFINFIIYFISFLLLFSYLKKFKNIYLKWIVLLIFFSGKWMNIILEPVNLAWTISFILSIFFALSLNLKEGYLKYLIIFLILLLSALNFGSGIVLLSYLLIYGFFIFGNKKYSYRLFYITTPVLIYFFVYKFLNEHWQENTSNSSLSILLDKNLFVIAKDYFGLSSIIFFPYFSISKYISPLIGFLQNMIILTYIFLFNKDFYKATKNIILSNPFLVIGIIGCLLVVIVRGSVFEQIRYSSFSIFFQIGFFIFLYQSYPKIFLFFKKKVFLYFLLISYFISIIGPHTGIHFALSRAAIFNQINLCYKSNIQDCNEVIYHSTLYNGDWLDYNVFLQAMNHLKIYHLSFLK